MQISKQAITWQQLNAFRHVNKIKSPHPKKNKKNKTKKKRDAHPEYFRNCWVYRDQRRVSRLPRADRKAAVTVLLALITTRVCRRASLNTQRIEADGLQRWGPHTSPTKNRKLRPWFSQPHQIWTVGHWKKRYEVYEPRRLMRHSDGWVRICHKGGGTADWLCDEVILTAYRTMVVPAPFQMRVNRIRAVLKGKRV